MRWQTDIPAPTLTRKGSRQEVVDLIDMPIGASIFFRATNDQVHCWMQNARKRVSGATLSRRFAEEDGVRGYRVWKLAGGADGGVGS